MAVEPGDTSVLVQDDGVDLLRLSEEATAVDPRTYEKGPRSPEVLTAYAVYSDPKITVIPQFLNEDEIQHLLDLAEACWIPSTVGSGVYSSNDESKDLRNKQSKNRTSYSCMLRSSQTEMVRSIEHRLASLASLEVKYLERLNMVRYSPGQLFNRHHDGRFRPKTVFIYLNDLPENDGGETFFPELGLKFVPRKGAAVMWSNILSPGVDDQRTIHLGLPPRTSTKFGVNCFFTDKPLREWEAENDAALGAAGPMPLSCLDPLELKKDTTEVSAGQLKSFVLCEDPKLRVIPSFLSEDEVNALLAILKPVENQQEADLDSIARIEQRMANVAGYPVHHMEPLKVAKCTPDMTPDGHDLSDTDYLKRFGAAVVFLFLNDAEAADLVFPKLRVQVRSREGCAVVWSTTSASTGLLRHQAQPPRLGARFAAMGHFRAEPVRAAA